MFCLFVTQATFSALCALLSSLLTNKNDDDMQWAVCSHFMSFITSVITTKESKQLKECS